MHCQGNYFHMPAMITLDGAPGIGTGAVHWKIPDEQAMKQDECRTSD